MDQRNAYGLPQGGHYPHARGQIPIQGGLPGQQASRGAAPPPAGMMSNPYMNDMLFESIALPHMSHSVGYPRGMAPPTVAVGGLGLPHHHVHGAPPMVSPEDDIMNEFMSTFVPNDLNDTVGITVDPHAHMRHVPAPSVFDQQAHLAGLSQRQLPQMPLAQPAVTNVPRMPPQMNVPPTQSRAPPPSQANTVTAVAPVVPTSSSSSSIVSPNVLARSHSSSASVIDSRTMTLSGGDGAGSNSDDDMSHSALILGDADDDSNKKKERRRQQVRYASRRRRKKQKDEESFLRDRIEELKEQIRIIGGEVPECSQVNGMSEQALTEAYEKQMITVQNLRSDNNKLKEQLLQHENFARMIQYGLNALPSDCRDMDKKKITSVPLWFSDQMNPLHGPTLVVDLGLCHEAVRQGYNELKTFGPSVNSKTNVCFAMGWKTELWANNTCLNFRAERSITERNIREVANASWGIITSTDKCKRIYPDVKQFRILQKVTDDIVVLHRIASVASDMSDREFISVAFRVRDGNDYFVGIKSIDVKSATSTETYIRGEECQGWMFTGGADEKAPWKAHFLGYYDVKGEKDDKVLNQLANEAMFGMLRWESEAMHPLNV